MTDDQMMHLAIKEAEKAFSEGEVPVGAVLMQNNTVIASEHNRCRSLNDPTAHAELLALQKGVKKLGTLKDCTLFVTLEPCAMCAGAAVNTQLGRLVYGAFDDKEGCCGSLIDLTDHWLAYSCETTGGVLAEECSYILSAFFKNKH